MDSIRPPRVPEVLGRGLDAVENDGQRTVSFLESTLTALRMVREALGITIARNEREVPDPTDAILHGGVRAPRM